MGCASSGVKGIIRHFVWLELILVDWWRSEKEDLSIMRSHHRMRDYIFQAALIAVEWDMLVATSQDRIIGAKEYSLLIGIKRGT